jgi:hypothetical protein
MPKDEKDNKIYGFDMPVKKPSEGYFIAKRQIMESVDRIIADLHKSATTCRKEGRFSDLTIITFELSIFLKLGDYLRNGMLWDATWGE